MPHDSLRHILLMLLLLSSAGLAGCTFSSGSSSNEFSVRYQAPWATRHKVVRSGVWMLSNKAPVCLLYATPAADPDFDSDSDLDPVNDQLALALQSALSRHFQVVSLSPNIFSESTGSNDTLSELKMAVRLSGEYGCGAIVASQVLHQQDEMNSLEEIHRDQESHPARTFRADQLLVQVIVYSASGAVLDIATVESEAGGWTLHRRSPPDLFEQAMQAYVARISSAAHQG